MKHIFTQLEYEQRGYCKGTPAKVISTGEFVIIVSNPKIQDKQVFIWVAMKDDTHLRYFVNVNDLEIV